MNIHDVDVELLINTIASSDGDVHLAAERLSRKLDVPRDAISEYDITERIANLDIQSSDTLASKLRTLLTIRLYNLIHAATVQLAFNLSELKPAELARTHASLVNSFASLTAPATKVTFDFDRELVELSREFGIPVEDMKGEIKGMEKKIKAIK